MKKVECIPYEELSIKSIDDGNYIIETPWLSRQIKINTSSHNPILKTLNAIATSNSKQIDHIVLSDFLKQLNLPINYIAPAENLTATDIHSNENLKQFNTLTKSEFRNLLNLKSNHKNNEWNWDTDAILDFSKISTDQYSPQTILSIARRFHLLDCVENDKTYELYEYCKSPAMTNNSNIDEKLATIVYQNYYVTAMCQSSLSAAENSAQNAKSDLHNFMQDEDGHDLLMMRAVHSLQKQTDQIYLAQSTKNIMSLLKQSGQYNFLSFCIAIDFFEKPNFDETDPLADLLLFHQKIVAADCLQKHKNINDDGKHDSIALQFLKPMKPINRDSALFAIRLAEILTDEMTSVTSEILDLFNVTNDQKQTN